MSSFHYFGLALDRQFLWIFAFGVILGLALYRWKKTGLGLAIGSLVAAALGFLSMPVVFLMAALYLSMLAEGIIFLTQNREMPLGNRISRPVGILIGGAIVVGMTIYSDKRETIDFAKDKIVFSEEQGIHFDVGPHLLRPASTII